MTKVYLRIFFASLLLCYAVFVDWQRLCAVLGSRLCPRDLVLTFDARNPRHRRVVAALRTVDVLQRVQYADSSPGAGGDDGAGVTRAMTVSVEGHTLTGLQRTLSLVVRIPLGVPLWPLLALGSAACRRPPVNASPVVAANDRPHPRLAPTVIVGGLLLAANIYCGVTRTDSWPFSVYPSFASLYPPTLTTLEAIVQRPDGSARRVEIDLEKRAMDRFREEAPAVRAVRLEAIRDLLVAKRVKLRPGESLQLYEVTRSTLPEERQRAPIRKELLAEFPSGPARSRNFAEGD